jgi:tight adherence protein B
LIRVRRALSIAGATALLALAAVAAASAAPPRLTPTGTSTYPQRSFLLTLPSPRALVASQVQVTENGVPVSGLSVAREGTSAASSSAVVLAIDASGSMSGKPIVAALTAARAFAAARLPNEQLAIVTFNRSVNVLQPFTTSQPAITAALANQPTIGVGTRIYDGLAQSLQLIDAAQAATASVVILTDGSDVGSQIKPRVVLGELAAAHVRVFSVGIPSPTYNAKALDRMASTTGGSYVEATTLSTLTPILARISARLSREYLVSYRSLVYPLTHVKVAVHLQGFNVPPASNAYVSPPYHLVPAAALKQSGFERLITSTGAEVVMVMIVVVLIIVAMASILAQQNDPLVTRVGGFVSLPTEVQLAPELDTAEKEPTKGAIRGGLVAATQRLADRRGMSERLRTTLELADIPATPGQIVLLTVAGVILLGFILFLVMGALGLPIALVVVPFSTRWLILRKLRKKRAAFASELPDNLDVLASALRAGHSLVSGLKVVAEDAGEPAKTEFQRVLREEQFGVQFEDALKVCSVRMDNRDLEQVALVARLQREMGSNSAEVLDRVIDTVRGRVELRRLVHTLTAQGRLSRWILTGLPIALALILTLTDSHYMHPLFHKLLGRGLLLVCAIMVTVGSIIIGKIVDIKA